MQPKQPFVFLATPCFTSYVSYEFAGSCEQTGALLAINGIKSVHRFQANLQFVEVARNVLLSQFLTDHPDATDLFFIDDDIGFQAQKVMELAMRPEPVVAGVYPLKATGAPQYPVFLSSNDGHPIENEGLVLASQVPGGFMRLKREVVEHLASTASTYQWLGLGRDGERDDRVVFKVFDRGDRDGEFVGEDVMFCRQLAKEGIPIWVDPDIEFAHRGSHRWTGSFRHALDAYIEGTNQVAKVKEIVA